MNNLTSPNAFSLGLPLLAATADFSSRALALHITNPTNESCFSVPVHNHIDH